jgi:hypothetical protein
LECPRILTYIFGAWFPQHSNINFTYPFCTKKAVKISYSNILMIYILNRAEMRKLAEGAGLWIQEQGEKGGTMTHMADGKPRGSQ